MQTTENKDFSGHTELENNEQYLHKYNSHIVNLCGSSIHEPDSILDFGAGIGTLSLILKNIFNIRPVTVEIDKKNARVSEPISFFTSVLVIQRKCSYFSVKYLFISCLTG
jgi:16S rRNA A1518/A1519 N6-dimethyltransferase RsmA/KsgA/DIM1 with predicted DNA glycosylase/AP lyase activity